jgi:hypothetical protein
MNPDTAIFYDLYKNDKIGHKIVSTIQCDCLDIDKTVSWLRNKMRGVIQNHPHFKCRVLNHEWQKVSIDLNDMVFYASDKRNIIVNKILNETWDNYLPQWKIIVTSDNCILFICDHVYGDGAFIANVMRSLFDDSSLNNVPLSKMKTKMSLISKIYLFIKIIYLIYKRFYHTFQFCGNNELVSEINQMRMSEMSLCKLKSIRDRFSCSDKSKISINDIIHTIIVKTNSLYFNKDMVSSAAIFNMRKRNTEDTSYTEQNKLGYILLSNKISGDLPPEELLCEVHDFMQFYKETPSTLLISKCMHMYYTWDKEAATQLLASLNKNVDFIISNYLFQYKDKEIQDGVKILNAYGSVTPCHAKQMYSITTYGDKVNIFLTYKNDIISDSEKLRRCFERAISWMYS